MDISKLKPAQKSRLCDLADAVLDELEEIEEFPLGFWFGLALGIVIRGLRKAHTQICGEMK